MDKTLIIAEKPSVAADIARALGGFRKKEGYFENEQYVLSSASGHLLEIYPPEGCEPKKGKWQIANLPVLPPAFDLRPIAKTEPRLKLLLRFIKRQDVTALINACDAGREGELIFRYIVQYTRTSKPIQRLWLQSMTPASIREGFTVLRSGAEMQPLADAAMCRSESDWLIGINGTRAITSFNSKHGGFFLTTVGRVQTPTLMIVVEREEKIKNFIPKDYWEIKASFQAAAGLYEGIWFDRNFSLLRPERGAARDYEGQAKAGLDPARENRPAETAPSERDEKPERIWKETQAEAICRKCRGQPGAVSEESRPTTQIAPLLYDLTSLQREANNRFSFSAKHTLQIAQRLYEHHKALTYPRTDARALPEDYPEVAKKVLSALTTDGRYGAFARQILNEKWVRPSKRIFNNEKVSDHFAIIPTNVLPKTLQADESKIYDMVTKRFLAVFFPPAEFLVTTRITTVQEETFKSEGKVLVRSGWLAVYGKESPLRQSASGEASPGELSEASAADQQPNATRRSPDRAVQRDGADLTPVPAGETVQTANIEIAKQQTKPPARFTEATLLTAMEGAGKLVDDEELRQAMSAKGLGTPATRASIIEGLIYEKYLVRQARELQPTAKAFSLTALLRGLKIAELCSPEMTGEWEFKLKQMEHKQLGRAEFMREIASMAGKIVEKVKNSEHDSIPGDFGRLRTPCPKCGGEIREQYSRFQCVGCGYFLWKNLAGRQFEANEMDALLSSKRSGPLSGFHSHKGRLFSAVVKLNAEHKIEFDFADSRNMSAQTADKTKEPLGRCPVCAAQVFETGSIYACEKAFGDAPSCSFRSGSIILHQPVDRTQMAKLLATGKSDLLTGFISKKGRPFKAYLVVKDGKVGFEFLPRKNKREKSGVSSQKSEES